MGLQLTSPPAMQETALFLPCDSRRTRNGGRVIVPLSWNVERGTGYCSTFRTVTRPLLQLFHFPRNGNPSPVPSTRNGNPSPVPPRNDNPSPVPPPRNDNPSPVPRNDNPSPVPHVPCSTSPVPPLFQGPSLLHADVQRGPSLHHADVRKGPSPSHMGRGCRWEAAPR